MMPKFIVMDEDSQQTLLITDSPSRVCEFLLGKVYSRYCVYKHIPQENGDLSAFEMKLRKKEAP